MSMFRNVAMGLALLTLPTVAHADFIVGVGFLLGTPGPDTMMADPKPSADFEEMSVTLKGRAGNDYNRGATGSDVLYGGPGDDILDGSWESDLLVGGPGADVFETFDDFNNGESLDSLRIDTIADFEPDEGDRINLSYWDGNSKQPGWQTLAFIGNAPFSGNGAEIRYSMGRVLVDTTGDKEPELTIKVPGQQGLTIAAFLVNKNGAAAKRVALRKANAMKKFRNVK